MGEIRQLPAQDQRVESGPVQFGDDWPGVFIRGDDAGAWAMQLKLIIEHYLPDDPLNIAMLKGLQDTLASCVVGPATDLVKVSGGFRERVERDLIEMRIGANATPCEPCHGLGVRAYGSTATWRGGAGGQAITSDVCDRCWGSGNADRPWPSHRHLLRERQRTDASESGRSGGANSCAVADPSGGAGVPAAAGGMTCSKKG